MIERTLPFLPLPPPFAIFPNRIMIGTLLVLLWMWEETDMEGIKILISLWVWEVNFCVVVAVTRSRNTRSLTTVN